MATKHDLQHSILSILRHNKDGSFATQANRKTQLLKLAYEVYFPNIILRMVCDNAFDIRKTRIKY